MLSKLSTVEPRILSLSRTRYGKQLLCKGPAWRSSTVMFPINPRQAGHPSDVFAQSKEQGLRPIWRTWMQKLMEEIRKRETSSSLSTKSMKLLAQDLLAMAIWDAGSILKPASCPWWLQMVGATTSRIPHHWKDALERRMQLRQGRWNQLSKKPLPSFKGVQKKYEDYHHVIYWMLLSKLLQSFLNC